jgi:hypothetical protein
VSVSHGESEERVMAAVTKIFQIELWDQDGNTHTHVLEEDEVKSLIVQCCEALGVESPVEEPSEDEG